MKNCFLYLTEKIILLKHECIFLLMKKMHRVYSTLIICGSECKVVLLSSK